MTFCACQRSQPYSFSLLFITGARWWALCSSAAQGPACLNALVPKPASGQSTLEMLVYVMLSAVSEPFSCFSLRCRLKSICRLHRNWFSLGSYLAAIGQSGSLATWFASLGASSQSLCRRVWLIGSSLA